MTENGTLEGVSTLRFASFAPGGSRSRATVSDAQERVPPKVAAQLQAMLAKELDLAAYLGASDVTRVMAVASGAAINVLAKLANDVNVSVEVGAGLPRSEAAYDRHEIIAKRGVACDQTVDTHTPHASIRVSNAQGMEEFTDVDTELFGLTYEEVWNVRAAFALLQACARRSRSCRAAPPRRCGRPRGRRPRRPPRSRSRPTRRRPRRPSPSRRASTRTRLSRCLR